MQTLSLFSQGEALVLQRQETVGYQYLEALATVPLSPHSSNLRTIWSNKALADDAVKAEAMAKSISIVQKFGSLLSILRSCRSTRFGEELAAMHEQQEPFLQLHSTWFNSL